MKDFMKKQLSALLFFTCVFFISAENSSYSEFALAYKYKFNENLNLKNSGEVAATYESGNSPFGFYFMSNTGIKTLGYFDIGFNADASFDYSPDSKCIYNDKDFETQAVTIALTLGPELIFNPFKRHSLGITPGIKGTMLIPYNYDFANLSFYASYDTTAFYEFYFSRDFNKGLIFGATYSIPLIGYFGTNDNKLYNYPSLTVSPTSGNWQIFAGFSFGMGKRSSVARYEKKHDGGKVVAKYGKYGYMRYGKWVIQPVYNKMEKIGKNLDVALIATSGKDVSVYNAYGSLIIQPGTYSQIIPFTVNADKSSNEPQYEGTGFAVQKDDKWAFCDIHGNLLTPFIYGSINEMQSSNLGTYIINQLYKTPDNKDRLEPVKKQLFKKVYKYMNPSNQN